MLSQVEEKKWLVASSVEPHEVCAWVQGREGRRARRRGRRRGRRSRRWCGRGTTVADDGGGMLLIWAGCGRAVYVKGVGAVSGLGGGRRMEAWEKQGIKRKRVLTCTYLRPALACLPARLPAFLSLS